MAEKKISEMTSAEIWFGLACATDADALSRAKTKPAEDKDCCRAVRLLRELGLRHMWVYRFEAAELNYCPECRKRL